MKKEKIYTYEEALKIGDEIILKSASRLRQKLVKINTSKSKTIANAL